MCRLSDICPCRDLGPADRDRDNSRGRGFMFRLILVRCGSLLGAARLRFPALLLLAAFVLAPTIAPAQPASQAQGSSVSCNGILPAQALRKGSKGAVGQQPNLIISSACVVSRVGSYYYGNVNIIAGG